MRDFLFNWHDGAAETSNIETQQPHTYLLRTHNFCSLPVIFLEREIGRFAAGCIRLPRDPKGEEKGGLVHSRLYIQLKWKQGNFKVP